MWGLGASLLIHTQLVLSQSTGLDLGLSRVRETGKATLAAVVGQRFVVLWGGNVRVPESVSKGTQWLPKGQMSIPLLTAAGKGLAWRSTLLQLP